MPFGVRPATVAALLAVLSIVALPACSKVPQTGEDDNVTRLGAVEVTARLEEIRGEFINRPMYDYGFVMKYKVLKTHRGTPEGDTIYIGHYNPLKPRDRVADARVPEVGGNVRKFKVGDIHRMALEAPIDEFFMGGVVNRHFEEHKGVVYWAVWTNQVVE